MAGVTVTATGGIVTLDGWDGIDGEGDISEGGEGGIAIEGWDD